LVIMFNGLYVYKARLGDNRANRGGMSWNFGDVLETIVNCLSQDNW